MTRAEVASFLREFVDELDSGRPGTDLGDRGSGVEPDRTKGERAERAGRADRADRGERPDRAEDTGRADRGAARADERPQDTRQITFIVDGASATVTVPETVNFDIEVESRSPLLTSGQRQQIEFEISWEIRDPGRDDDTIDMV